MIPAVRLATLAGAAAVATAALVAGQGATVASAVEQGGTLISLDGEHFSGAPEGSIFPADVALVPGTTATARFWVRNNSDLATSLGIAVSGATASAPEFIEALAVRAATDATPEGVAIPLTAVTCTSLLQGEVLDPGATTEVRIGLSMAPDSGNSSQSSAADATLSVSLTDARAAAPAADCGSGGSLPLTSSEDPGAPQVVKSTTVEGGTAGQDVPGTSAGDPPLALPTLPFADSPTAAPVLGILSAAALAALAVVLILLRRKRRSDVSS